MRTIAKTLVICAGLLALATPAAAQNQGREFGVRAGVSGDPNQFFFGGHYETRPLLPRFTFRPNVEVGFGDDTLVALNIEFAYSIPLYGKPWRIYLGGGPAANIYSGHGDGQGHGDGADVGGGFNFMVGAQHDHGFLVEFKVGAIDSPTVKFTVGYAFK